MKIKSVLSELKEKRFFALERTAERPTRILRELTEELGSADLRYTFLKPRSDGIGQSLSGRHGFGEFPLHTDGAHLKEPPDYLILIAPKTRSTPTMVADPRDLLDLSSECVKQAVFSFRRRERVFNLHFLNSRKGSSFIRYNPDIMTPKNSAARSIQCIMSELRTRAFQLHWDKYALLVLDNRSMLHGRAQINGTTSYIRRIEVKL